MYRLSEILEGKFFPVPSPDELLGDGALEVDKQSLFYKSLKHCCLESPFIVKVIIVLLIIFYFQKNLCYIFFIYSLVGVNIPYK